MTDAELYAPPEVPALVPAGWRVVDWNGGQVLARTYGNLGCLFSIDTIDDYVVGERPASFLPNGRWRHLSISRQHGYPKWDDMLGIIRGCGLFEAGQDVVMVVPPPERYVNLHPNCFHWWQPIETEYGDA